MHHPSPGGAARTAAEVGIESVCVAVVFTPLEVRSRAAPSDLLEICCLGYGAPHPPLDAVGRLLSSAFMLGLHLHRPEGVREGSTALIRRNQLLHRCATCCLLRFLLKAEFLLLVSSVSMRSNEELGPPIRPPPFCLV